MTALAGGDEERFEREVGAVATMAGRTQHTFAYTLAVARRLAGAAHDDDDDAPVAGAAAYFAGAASTAAAAAPLVVHTPLAASAARLARELELRAHHQ
jgi:hypothetical protein